VTIGSAELWCADCRDVLPELRAHACVTDPPYGVELGSTKGSGGAHGLALEAYASYTDTYENYVQQIVPALTLALQQSERAAVFIGPHIHELPKFDALGGVYCSAATARHQWGFKNFLPVLLYGTYPDLQNGAKLPTVLAINGSDERGHGGTDSLSRVRATRLASGRATSDRANPRPLPCSSTGEAHGAIAPALAAIVSGRGRVRRNVSRIVHPRGFATCPTYGHARARVVAIMARLRWRCIMARIESRSRVCIASARRSRVTPSSASSSRRAE
jgi:hypothetical protein